jgi:hypothetical protein
MSPPFCRCASRIFGRAMVSTATGPVCVCVCVCAWVEGERTRPIFRPPPGTSTGLTYINRIIMYSVIGRVLFVSLRLHKHLHYSNFNGIDVEVDMPNLSHIYYLLYYNIYCRGNTRFAFLFLIRSFVKNHVLDPMRFLLQNT